MPRKVDFRKKPAKLRWLAELKRYANVAAIHSIHFKLELLHNTITTQ